MKTRRELAKETLNHTEPARVVIDFGGHRSSGIAVQAYGKLREYLGLKKTVPFVYDVIQQLALIEPDVLEITGGDFLELSHFYLHVNDYWKDWRLQDGTPCKIPAYLCIEENERGDFLVRGRNGKVIAAQKKGTLYFEQTCWPYENSEEDVFDDLAEELKKISWWSIPAPPGPASVFDPAGTNRYAEAAKYLHDNTDKAIYAIFGGNAFETATFAFKTDNFFCDMLTAPTRVHRFLDRLLEFFLKQLDAFLDAVGPYVDVIGFGDDLGMQTGTLISPDLYRAFIQPIHRILWKHVKNRFPEIKTCLHTCGSVYAILPDLIDAGIDAINPVQTNCRNMEPQRLKIEFGDKITFWGGGCDTRSVLPRGTPAEVERDVQKNLEILHSGGGFVFQQVHNIVADVPPANILAMFDAVRKFND